MAEEVKELRYSEAFGEGIKEEMRRDERVVIWGTGATRGGEFSTTEGIYEEFGADRCRDTTLSEVAFTTMGLGAAISGLRPIVMILGAAFVGLAGDSIMIEIGGVWRTHFYKRPVPIVIIAPLSQGRGMGPGHCWSTEALLMHSPHLKVVVPSTPADVKGLIKTAIRDDYPVVFLANTNLNPTRGPVPVGDYTIPFGKADVKREGSDITIVAYSAMAVKSLAAAEALSKEGISVEVVDLRTLVPLDVKTIVNSVRKTRRLLIAHEAMKRGGAAGEILWRIHEAAPDVLQNLKAPFQRLAAPNVSLPHGRELDELVTPQVEGVIKAVKEVCV